MPRHTLWERFWLSNLRNTEPPGCGLCGCTVSVVWFCLPHEVKRDEPGNFSRCLRSEPHQTRPLQIWCENVAAHINCVDCARAVRISMRQEETCFAPPSGGGVGGGAGRGGRGAAGRGRGSGPGRRRLRAAGLPARRGTRPRGRHRIPRRPGLPRGKAP